MTWSVLPIVAVWFLIPVILPVSGNNEGYDPPTVKNRICSAEFWKIVESNNNVHCYSIVTIPDDRSPIGNYLCRKLHQYAKLASFHSQAQVDVVYLIPASIGAVTTGLTYEFDEYVWQDGTPVNYTLWATGHPSMNDSSAIVELGGDKCLRTATLTKVTRRNALCKMEAEPMQKCSQTFKPPCVSDWKENVPFVGNQTCSGSAWVSTPTGFRFSSAKNARTSIDRTYIDEFNMPYVFHPNDKLSEGQTLFIEGKIENFCIDFSINLLAAVPILERAFTDGANTLHIAVNFEHSYLIFNAIKDNQWIIVQPYKYTNPFVKGGKFDIRVHMFKDHNEVVINGRKVYKSKHYLPLDIVDFINVIGNVELTSIRVGGHSFPVPYKQHLPANRFGLNDRLILIARSIGGNFGINFLNEQEDITFFFNVDFKRRTVTRNSLINSKWGTEETQGGFPFEENVEFTLGIVYKPHGLGLFVNNGEFSTFLHRANTPSTAYTSIELTENIEAFMLEVCN